MGHSRPTQLDIMARLALLLTLACLGCVSHRPADRRVTSDELAAPSIHFWKGGTIALDRIEIPKNIVVVRDK